MCPRIDVSDVVLDPDFCEPVVVTRRHETVNNYGRSVVTSTTYNIYATITAGTQQGVQRQADGQYIPDTIVVHSVFKLQGPATNRQPDLVTWAGRQFLVTKPYDYSHFGRGMVSAECTSIDYLDSTA